MNFVGEWFEQWRRFSDSLVTSPGWSGPWDVGQRVDEHGEPWGPYQVVRQYSEDEPASASLRSPSFARLVAELLPYLETRSGYRLRKTALGHEIVSLLDGEPGEVVGFVLGGDAARLESALAVAHYLARSPAALAAVLQAAGCEVVRNAFEALCSWIDFEDWEAKRRANQARGDAAEAEAEPLSAAATDRQGREG
jgi:hypothetical protein